MKSVSVFFPCVLEVLSFYSEAEKELLNPAFDLPGYGSIRYLYGFLDGLHSSGNLSDDYYMSCVAELQRFENSMKLSGDPDFV